MGASRGIEARPRKLLAYTHAFLVEGTAIRLINKERVLLHLVDYVRYADEVDVPPEITQEGIARAAGFSVPHFAQYVRPLVDEGMVEERRTHVKGHRRRRKVYTLTPAGRMQAVTLRNRFRSSAVRVRDSQGVREAPVDEVLKETRNGLTTLQVIRRLEEGGIVDLRTVSEPETALVEMTTDMPQVVTFTGREEELRTLTDDQGPRLLVVRGVAGIGKSSLAAKACEVLHGKRNLFWHRVQPWDTLASLLADLGQFLAALGRPGVRTVLARGTADRGPHVLREDLPGTRSFLVFDDVHDASSEALSLFRLLKDAVTEAPDVKAVVLTRQALPFYDRRDVALSPSVGELELTGLSPEDVSTLLSASEAKVAAKVGQRVGGHPLFFELVRTHPTASQALGDLRRFMEEEIYRELSDPQRTMMKLASLYRVAMPREALFCSPSLTHDVLLDLTQRALIRHVGEERYVLHDTIRDFFADLLTPAERRDLGAFAVSQLATLAEAALAEGQPLDALGGLANALGFAADDNERRYLSETFGDAAERIGDWEGALEAYQRVLDLEPEPETVARVHRKAAAILEDRGDVDSAVTELETAMKALGDTLSVERGWVYVLRCAVARDVDELEEAREYGEEALRVFRALGEKAGEAQALLELGYLDYTDPDGDPVLAEDRLRTALSLAEPLGDPVFLAKVHIALSNVVALERHAEEGLACLAAVDSIPGALADPHVRRSYLEMKAVINLFLNLEETKAAVADSMTLARKIGDPITEAVARFVGGLADLFRLHLEEARPPMEASSRELEAQGFSGLAVELTFYWALCTLLQDDLEGFREALSFLRDPSMARGVAVRYPRYQGLQGIARFLEGDEAGFHEAFSTALRCRRIQWAYFSHLLYGAALRAMGQEQEGKQHLNRARGLASDYGWKVSLERMPEMERILIDTLRGARGFEPGER